MDTVDRQVWWALGTRAGGESISSLPGSRNSSNNFAGKRTNVVSNDSSRSNSAGSRNSRGNWKCNDGPSSSCNASSSAAGSANLHRAQDGDVQTPCSTQARRASEEDRRETLAGASGLCNPCAMQARTVTNLFLLASPDDQVHNNSPMPPGGFHDLVRRAQAGDRQAMERLLELVRPHLENLAGGYADPAEPAESTSDLVQSVLVRAWQNIEQFRGGAGDDETFAMFQG